MNFLQHHQTIKVEIYLSYNLKQSKGMIYIQEYNTTDITDYSEQIKKNSTFYMYKSNLD